MLIRLTLLWLGLGLFVAPVGAEVVRLSAEFKPDPSKPNSNEFKNTTPNSGFCERYEAACKGWQIFSIGTQIELQADRAIPARHADPRQGAMFNVPAGWKDVPIFDTHGAESGVVQVRIAGIGGEYRLSERVQQLIGREFPSFIAHSVLWWEGDWMAAPRPCGDSPVGWADDWSFRFFWTTPVEGVCSKQAVYDIPEFSYKSFDFAYQLRTPNPLKMAPGVYTATTLYTVGPGADFDMGNIMQPTDGAIQLDFTLTVDHVFNIEIPPGGNKVVLVPQGGWQAWLNQGRRPTRLFRDQTFNIWASTPFKMSMECEHYAANSTCALQDDKNNQVPVDVSVSLPSGLSDAERQSVSRRRLRVDGMGTERFEPALYVDRKPGTLHFEVGKSAVEEMLQRDSLGYSGDITVIWDSQI